MNCASTPLGKQNSEQQLSFDFEGATKEISSLKSSIEEFIVQIIENNNQPTASELLKLIMREFGDISKYYFKEIISYFVDDIYFNNSVRSYIKTMLNESEVSQAIDGINEEPTSEFKSTLDDLFRRSANYHHSDKFWEAIDFASKFKNYSPYNNLLVKIQNPSCSYYATEKDWRTILKRTIKEDAQPMLILAPMTPVLLVYDLDDTEGEPLPDQFLNLNWAAGYWRPSYLDYLLLNASEYKILVKDKQLSSVLGGYATYKLDRTSGYKMLIALNNKLEAQSKFSVLIHEMAHILLGHLGGDIDKWWPSRSNLTSATCEIEAESVSYIVCNRLGIETSAPTYLSTYIKSTEIPMSVSVDLIFKVAGKLEQMANTKLPKKKSRHITA